MKEKIVAYLLARLSESSTVRGLIETVVSLGVISLSDNQAAAIVAGILALTGILKALLPDRFTSE